MNHRLGSDVGGTFTDLACLDPTTRRVSIGKVLTTADDPGLGVMAGSSGILDRQGVAFANVHQIVHGTTLVANALIQRIGAPTGLIADDGFIDVLETGVENRYDMFDLLLERPEPIVPRRLRFGIGARTAPDGTLLIPVDRAELEGIAHAFRTDGVEAVAVCMLNAFRNPTAERAVRDLLVELLPGVPVTLSSEVAPEIREFQRASTAVANACVQPMVDGYLGRLEAALHGQGFVRPLFVMLSEGGIGTVGTARAAPVRLVESGPAAGAMAAAAIARTCGIDRGLAFDMGGTTAKLCLLMDGKPLRAYATEVARLKRFTKGSGLPLRIPTVELIEIGAGGGSIARIGTSGLLSVGPMSAGAVPGPACYDQGGADATVTDANVVAGFLDPDAFLGGRMRLDRTAAERALHDNVAAPLGIDSDRAAAAVQEVVNENMAQAARIHAVEHGEDPRRHTLIAFGGAGPGHAWRVAEMLKLERFIVPMAAGVMSAIGMLVTPPAIELSRSTGGRLASLDLDEIDNLLADLEHRGRATLGDAGVDTGLIRTRRFAECRYAGQAYEVQTALPDGALADCGWRAIAEAFETRYAELYGRTLPGGRVEALTWRVQAEGPTPATGIALERRNGRPPRDESQRSAYFHGRGRIACRVVDRYGLKPGDGMRGPALIEEDESTTVVGPGASVIVDEHGNLVVAMGEA